jgi:hypothetical protein
MTLPGDWKSRLRSLRLIARLRGRTAHLLSLIAAYLVRAGGRLAERLSGATSSRWPEQLHHP